MKWLLPSEPFSAQALALLTDSRGEFQLVGPPHLRGEVANALYQRTRSQEPLRYISASEARASLDDFLEYPVAIEQAPGLYEASLSFALTHNLPSIYDSIYVVLARELGSDLWTADERLLRSIRGVAPWVHFIADYA